jgi:phosphoserine aminotransferase
VAEAESCESVQLFELLGGEAEKQIEDSLGEADRPSTDTKEAASELLQKAVRSELKVDYLVTGSWSLKVSQEAARLLGPKHVNIVTDAQQANGG